MGWGNKKSPPPTVSQVAPEFVGTKETYIGEGKLLRLVTKKVAFPVFEGDLRVADVFQKGKKIGDLKIADVAPIFTQLFGDTKMADLPAEEIPVWEVASRTIRHSLIMDTVSATWPEESYDPAIVLARLYQSIAMASELSKEMDRSLVDCMSNLWHARSLVEPHPDKNPYAVFWTYYSRDGGIFMGARPRDYYAGCTPHNRAFGGKVPEGVPAESSAELAPAS